jgi:hypothetical protein
VGLFFLDFFYGGIVSCFSAETTVGANVGGSENWMESPNTRVTNKCTQVTKKGETKNFGKLVLASKVVNPFKRALVPPFIGRRRDFYISRLPSNLGNILNVNTYMKVFYIPWFAGLISYIYKPANSSHFKPGLLRWRLWLGFLEPPKFYSRRSSLIKTPELRIPEIRGSITSWICHLETNNRNANKSQVRQLRHEIFED